MLHIRLKDIDTRTKVLAVVCLTTDAIFLGSLRVLPSAHVVWGISLCVAVLIAMVVGIVVIEVKSVGLKEQRTRDESTTFPTYASSEGRRETLNGKWIGTLRQRFKGKLIESAIEMDFKAEVEPMEGIATLDHPDGPGHPKLRFNVVDAFFHDPILKLDYRNTVDSVLQFGCFVGRLDAAGKTLKGRFVGYGSLVDQIAFGEVCASKAT